MNQTSLLYWLLFLGVCARARILWLFKYMETFMETLMETLYAGCFAFAGFVLEALTKEKVSCGVVHLNKSISHLILTNM